MTRRRDRFARSRALVVIAVALSAATTAGGCGGAERAEREREMASLKSQVDQLKQAQDANAKDLAKLAGEMKALDAQSAFLVGEAKASAEDRARVKSGLDDTNKTLRDLQSTVDAMGRAGAPAAAAPAAKVSIPPNATADQIYATALASLQADANAQAVVEFRELTKRFPENALASNAQYWIGEAYYRQRDFDQALAEFRKVVDGYAKSAQVPEALLKIGLCYRALKEPARGREVWEQITKDYPDTNAATQARSLLSAPASSAPTQ
jgi:tol-pal system protein YbgF